MKSNICKIEKGTRDLDAILKESERVAEYNRLTHKQGLQLRLLCEEIDGMLPHIIDEFEGDLWIEFEDGICKVHVSIEIPNLNSAKKSELISVSTTKKNVEAVGIVGKIRDSIENYFLNEDVQTSFAMSAGINSVSEYSDYASYSYLWSLEQYRCTVQKEERAEAWDELEKSVLASVADDVVVGVRGKCADIVVVKKFA